MKNVIVDADTLKDFMEVIDDVGWWLKRQDDEYSVTLLERLRSAKHALEDRAKECDEKHP